MGSLKKKKIAFIIQRCGEEVNGGAEQHCLQFAERLGAEAYHTEILTTCALSYITWENHYPPGIEQLGTTSIHRFSVDEARDINTFNAFSRKLHACSKNHRQDEEKWLNLQGPCSIRLESYIRENKGEYDYFFFFCYLYQPYFLLPHVIDKAVLMPLAHDEQALKMTIWDSFFQLPKQFIFNTHEEKKLLKRRFPRIKFDGPVVGCGVEKPSDINPQRFRDNFSVHCPFLLYIGRIDESKGCLSLVSFFTELRKTETCERKLIFMGKAEVDLPHHPDIIHLGFVDEQDKWDGLAAADWLVNFSLYESLSLVLLEAWSVGTPTLVWGQSDVLVGQSRRSNGGLWCEKFSMFRQILHNSSPLLRCQMGRQGERYVASHYTWEKVIEKISGVLG